MASSSGQFSLNLLPWDAIDRARIFDEVLGSVNLPVEVLGSGQKAAVRCGNGARRCGKEHPRPTVKCGSRCPPTVRISTG